MSITHANSTSTPIWSQMPAMSQPLIITDLMPSTAYVSGMKYDTGLSTLGTASIGQNTPDSRIDGKRIRGMNCIAWNSFFALDESRNPKPWVPAPNTNMIRSTVSGFPTICMSNNATAVSMMTTDWMSPTNPNASAYPAPVSPSV